MNQWTAIEKSDLFKLSKLPISTLETKDLAWSRITIEMSLDKTVNHRTRYTILDLLASFGGFMGIFRWIFGQFMIAWNFQALDNFLVSNLYQVRLRNKKAFNQVENFDRKSYPNLCGYLLSWVPTCCCCL